MNNFFKGKNFYCDKNIRIGNHRKVGGWLGTCSKEDRNGGRPRIPQEKIDRINSLKDQGWSLRKITKEVGTHHGTVAQYLNN